jgi:predicted nucleic acid-binding protein
LSCEHGRFSGYGEKGQAMSGAAASGAIHGVPFEHLSTAPSVADFWKSRKPEVAREDYLIAGVCLAHTAILLTRNRKHFERVPGLVLGWGAGE